MPDAAADGSAQERWLHAGEQDVDKDKDKDKDKDEDEAKIGRGKRCVGADDRSI